MDIIITSVITNTSNYFACNCLFVHMSHVRLGMPTPKSMSMSNAHFYSQPILQCIKAPLCLRLTSVSQHHCLEDSPSYKGMPFLCLCHWGGASARCPHALNHVEGQDANSPPHQKKSTSSSVGSSNSPQSTFQIAIT